MRGASARARLPRIGGAGGAAEEARHQTKAGLWLQCWIRRDAAADWFWAGGVRVFARSEAVLPHEMLVPS
jgi:hypothetical protein